MWPLSLPVRPKQFHALAGDRTMIQDTATRSQEVEGVVAPVVVCNLSQSRMVIDQLVEVGTPPGMVILEPEGRNTAPAAAAAALRLSPEAVMAVFPADHVIADTEAFGRALTLAVEAATDGSLVTLGVVPTRPDTGYGYIGAESGSGKAGRPIHTFVEKPDADEARRLVSEGYLWNSGMFVFTAAAIIDELRQWSPDVVDNVAEAVASGAVESGGATVTLGPEFANAPSISIDHAVMERTSRGLVVPLDAGWTDVGSWQALWEAASPGETVTRGPVYIDDVNRSYVRAESRPVAVVGLDDVVVVETPEAVLVIDRRRAQDVRTVAEWFAGLDPES